MSWKDILKEERRGAKPAKVRTLSSFEKEMKAYYLENRDEYFNKVNVCYACGIVQNQFGEPKMIRTKLEHWDSGNPMYEPLDAPFTECEVCLENDTHEDGFTISDPSAKIIRLETIRPTEENKQMANDIVQNMRVR